MPNKNIEAKVVGGKGHFLVYLVNENIVAKAEATNVISGNNEFFKVKMGLPIEGMSTLFDEQGIINNAITKFTPLIYKDKQTIANYINMLDVIRETEENNETNRSELFNKLNSLTKTMELNNVRGVEAINGVIKFASLGFLGENVEKAWIKHKINNTNGEISYRSCLVVSQNEIENNFFILDSTNMKVTQLSREELVEKFNSGQYSYKDNKYSIKALKDDIPLTLDDEESMMRNDYFK